jgi:WD40 repeat protein
MRVWNVATGKCTHTLTGHTGGVMCVAFDGQTIASGGRDGTVHIWRGSTYNNTVECAREKDRTWVHRVWLCAVPNAHIVVSVDSLYMYINDIGTGARLCTPIECYQCQ